MAEGNDLPGFPFPPELLAPEKLDEACKWIREQPVDRKIVCKYMIIEWCYLTGVPLTDEIVARVYAG